MADEQGKAIVTSGRVRLFVLAHRTLLWVFGVFLVIATFIAKTEVRDNVKGVTDAIDSAQAAYTASQNNMRLFEEFALQAQQMEFIEGDLDTIHSSVGSRHSADWSWQKDAADRAAAHASLDATGVLLVSTGRLYQTLPPFGDVNKKLNEYAERLIALPGDTQPDALMRAEGLNLDVMMLGGVVFYRSNEFKANYDMLYHGADIVCRLLYVLGAGLALIGKLYGVKELEGVESGK
jgi:hypothetical protein